MQTKEGAELSKKTNQRRNDKLHGPRQQRIDEIKHGKAVRSMRDALERSTLAGEQQARRATEDEAEKESAWAKYKAAKDAIDEELGVEAQTDKAAKAEEKAAAKLARKEEAKADRQRKKDLRAAKRAEADAEVERILAEEATAKAAASEATADAAE